MTKATVTAVQPVGQWNEFYKFEVTLSDGASGLVFGKTPVLRFAIGEEVIYTQPKEGRLKLDRPAADGQPYQSSQTTTAGGGASYSSAPKKDYSKQHALAAACNYLNGTNATKEQVIHLAEYFATWLKGETPAQVQQTAPAEAPAFDGASSNGLPF